MSLLELSDDSLHKLFFCLNKDFATIARLRRTALKVETASCAVRDKPSVQAIRLCFIKAKFGSKSDGTYFTCEKYATLIFKGNCEDTERYYSGSLNDHDYTNELRFKYTQNKELVTINNATGDNKTVETAIEKLFIAFNKVKTVQHLELHFCQIDSNFLLYMERSKSLFSFVRGLHLLRCQIDLNTEEFKKFCDLFNLNTLEMCVETILGGDILSDENFMNLSDSIEVVCSYKVPFYLGRTDQDLNPPFQRITDRTLASWTADPPKNIDLWFSVTEFSFKALWKFILTVSKLPATKDTIYVMGVINKVSGKDLALAQRHRKIKWKCYKEDDIYPFVVNYKVKLENGVKVKFAARAPQYMRYNELLLLVKETSREYCFRRFRARFRQILIGKISFSNLYILHLSMIDVQLAERRQQFDNIVSAYDDFYQIMGEIGGEQMDQQEFMDLYENNPEELENRLNPSDDEIDEEDVSDEEYY